MKHARNSIVLLACLFAVGRGYGVEVQQGTVSPSYNCVLVVLGNEPLDDKTPTITMILRVKKAVEFYKEHPGSLLIFTGGKANGNISEARMMADIGRSLGVSTNWFRLEEDSRTTEENARLTAAVLAHVQTKRIYIVSDPEHLEWAMNVFKKFDVFKTAEPLASVFDRAKSIDQMRDYLAHHDSPRVRERMERLLSGSKGAT
jgi:uncharacterized SAM-binding protein YcdF (DUF218 family)